MPEKILFLTLYTFRITGGIQKMCRILGYTLQNIALKGKHNFQFWSMYDHPSDLASKYVEPQFFRGFSGNKVQYALQAIVQGYYSNKVIISHINLAFIGLVIKMIRPSVNVSLIAHGIEVWRDLGFIKKQFLKRCDQVVSVSEFTREQMINMHHVPRTATKVLNNGLDPFLELPMHFEKPHNLLQRYKLTSQHQVLFTLTRLASYEKYKGYDHVFEALKDLKHDFPNIRYILSGHYDDEEGRRIKSLIAQYEVKDLVILTGFVPEEDLIHHFLLSDIFVLPSKKEGFGIVFIEALSCGLPVIGGNLDGSADALLHGKLGTLIDPDNQQELIAAIRNYLDKPIHEHNRKTLQEACLNNFGVKAYHQAVEQTFMN